MGQRGDIPLQALFTNDAGRLNCKRLWLAIILISLFKFTPTVISLFFLPVNLGLWNCEFVFRTVIHCRGRASVCI